MAFRQAAIARPATAAGPVIELKCLLDCSFCYRQQEYDNASYPNGLDTMTTVRKTYIPRTSAIATMTRAPDFQGLGANGMALA
jgi:hypothetical protein